MTEKKAMLSVAEALDFLLQAAQPLQGVETLPTLAANGRVLARTQRSLVDVPPLDNSQMDGYAVRTADLANNADQTSHRLHISQRIPAGQIGTALAPGSAARIFTGAAIPEGADAVVMQEQCSVDGEFVQVQTAVEPGEWIRRRGEDMRAGADILQAGCRLRPQELGLAASAGLAQLPVFPKLKVAVFFTGDELAMPGETLKPGAIYNSNRFVLRGLLENLGCAVQDFGIVPDSLAATRDTLRRAAAEHDLIITSGGVSVGEEDHVKPAVEAEGRLNLWKIAVKPGKPLAFGEVVRHAAGMDERSEQPSDRAYFIGLPGNPVSSFVTFLIFVRPFILKLQGMSEVLPKSIMMRADFSISKADTRNEFLRARMNAQGGLDLFHHQGSGVLTSTVWADGLVDLPAGQTVTAGEMVKFIPMSALLY